MKNLADPGVREQVIQRIQNLTPDAQRRWGKMSVRQMICHLNDSFLGVMGERPISDAAGFAPRTILKFFALYVPANWPQGVPTRPEVDQHGGGTPPAEWERDRAALLQSLARFHDPGSRLGAHPIFGPLTRSEWMRWGYLHVDHHLRQFGA